MLQPAVAYDTLTELGVDFWCGVPDSLLKPFLSHVSDHAPASHHVITANEGAAIGVAAGYHLATGAIPAVYLQNSGLGNAVNPMLSLADERVYAIPMIIWVGWRGEPGTKDEPQHLKQGAVTQAMLDAMEIPHIVLDADADSARMRLAELVASCRTRSCPHVVLVRDKTFAGHERISGDGRPDLEMSREEALTLVAARLLPEDRIVATTGKLSRELYELRENSGSSHDRDFYTVGSMGHASAIALGLCLAPSAEGAVYCFDGDGAALMHMGTFSTIGHRKPARLKHILFNNGAHESVGGQPTTGFDTDFPAIARACGYTWAASVDTRDALNAAMDELIRVEGPALLEIRVAIRTRDDLGRPRTSPLENKRGFMKGSAR